MLVFTKNKYHIKICGFSNTEISRENVKLLNCEQD